MQAKCGPPAGFESPVPAMLLAIDPGPETCGVVLLVTEYNQDPPHIAWAEAKMLVSDLIYKVRHGSDLTRVAVESVESYGMPVGRDVFRTCYTIGRILEACDRRGLPCDLIPRKDVRLELCGTSTAKQTNTRQATRDLYPATGGGKKPESGTKQQPGPLYGVKSHAWEALAVGITAIAQRRSPP